MNLKKIFAGMFGSNDPKYRTAKPWEMIFAGGTSAAKMAFYVLMMYASYAMNAGFGIAVTVTGIIIQAKTIFDGVTDPIVAVIYDRLPVFKHIGKIRLFLLIGWATCSIAALLMFRILAGKFSGVAGIVVFCLVYALFVVGYTIMSIGGASTISSALTNDPKQRPLFTIFNTVGSLVGMGVMQFVAPILRANVADYSSADFYRVLTPIGVVISIVLTLLAVIGIWEKDQPKYFGVGGEKQKKVKVSEYIEIIKNNKPMQRLMIAGAGCKLALSIATNTTVLCMLYGCMMGNYDSLYLPMMILGYAASVPFFLLTVRTSQKKGQKASLVRYVSVALVCYVGVLALLLLWNPSNGMNLIFPSVNVYTILFIICFGVGYGAYYATADMPIPMVADCSDYETYRSGKYIPGIMGTLFSLVDKLVSSLAATVVGIAVGVIGLSNLPTADTPYAPGMNWVVIVLFCLIPMIAWAVTLIAMKGYSLTGDRMKEIQEVNAKRKEAIAEGMSLEEAMEKYK